MRRRYFTMAGVFEELSELSCRPYEGAVDFGMIKEWHDRESLVPLEEKFLPALGIVILSESQPVAAIFAHLSLMCKTAFLGAYIRHPDLPPRHVGSVLDHSLRALEVGLRVHEYEHLVCFMDLKSARSLMDRHGYLQHGQYIAVEKRLPPISPLPDFP